MARFLSSSWAAEVNAALESAGGCGSDPEGGLATVDGTFTVVQEVRGAPDGDVRVILRVTDGAMELSLEEAAHVPDVADHGGDEPDGREPDVTIVTSYDDAVAMSKGELAPAEALNAGRIRVRGDLSVLVAAQQMLMAARAHTQAVLSSTTTY